MIESTAGIVLRQFKYSDSGIITHLFTEKFGRMPVMVKGAGGKRNGKPRSYLRPLTVVDMVIYMRSSREIQPLKDISLLFPPAGIYANPSKSAIALFISEVLCTVLKEEAPQPEMFKYIFDAVRYFDSLGEGASNFHIAFLAGLCSYLGIEPSGSSPAGDTVLDYLNGTFSPIPPAHGNYAGKNVSGILSEFFCSSWDRIGSIPLTGIQRNEALSSLLKYYSLHFPSVRKINSIEVFKEVFR